MKNLYAIFLLQLICLAVTAQTITCKTNGYTTTFKKVDSLFFNEYAGTKTEYGKTKAANTTVFNKLLQFKKSVGIITKNSSEKALVDSTLGVNQIKFTTPFYVTGNNNLVAPTATLYFVPQNNTTVLADFSKYGNIENHPIIKNAYYLYLNTAVYNNGDKIFALCDSLFNCGLASIIEPAFLRKTILNSDPLLPNEWNITNTGLNNGTVGADMKVADVWAKGITGAGIKVAVIDDGTDLKHPDLAANLLPGYDATGNNSAGAPNYDAYTYNYHGTCTAGIIAEMQNNNIGGVGVAYNAKILPIRYSYYDLTGSFFTYDNWVVNCFAYALANGADIISCSWTYDQSAQIDAVISTAITTGRGGKGTLVVAGTGNLNKNSIDYPASNSNVIAVGASTQCDTRKKAGSSPPVGVIADTKGPSCDGETTWGSNYGTGLSVLAPGVKITTTTLPQGTDYTNAYRTDFGGTSAAAPNVAGVLALMLSANPDLSATQARQILESTCDKIGGYTYQTGVANEPNGSWSTDAGYGRVNALNAVNHVYSISGNSVLCTSDDYRINVPSGLAVTWSASTSGLISLQANGNTVTATKIGPYPTKCVS